MTDQEIESTSELSQRLDLALRHIESARTYTHSLIDDLSDDEWYWQPPQGVTHIAWQVGHLAMAQYGLTLFRQRGRQSVDTSLMSSAFRKKFMKGTVPLADRDQNPTREEILAVRQRVHEQMCQELPTFADHDLDEPVDPPHSTFATRYGALIFAGDHEMLHAGQIGLIRRLMGKDPVR